MEVKDINAVSAEIKSFFQKAIQAIDKNNADYAVSLLQGIVLKEPGFLAARDKLRVAEQIQQANSGFLKKTVDSLKAKKIVKTGQLDFLRGKYNDSMLKAEEALTFDVKDWGALKLLGESGEALSALFIAVEAYELAIGFYPKNTEVIIKLADLYRKLGRGKDELKLRQRLVDIAPNNLEYKQELRSAGAMATMEKDGDEKVGSFRDKLKDSKEATLLEQSEKQIHNVDDVKDLLISLKEKLQTDPNSIQIIKDLAWAYYKGNSPDDAIKYFRMLEEKQDHFDPMANKALESAILSINKSKIESLSVECASAQSQEKKNELLAEIENIKNSDSALKKEYALKRVSVYPNDLQLKYELALIYWELGEYDNAIEQFQSAQKHPKFNFSANVYLGRCFFEKGHNELAIDQLSKVLKMENYTDKELLDAVYYLGLAFEKSNDTANAKECFKKVYSVSSKYKDIAEKIQRYYSQQQQ